MLCSFPCYCIYIIYIIVYNIRILSDWLRRHRSTVREVKATSKKLVELLAESVLWYGAELWTWRTKGPVENVQIWVARIYLGVGRLHPLVPYILKCICSPVIFHNICSNFLSNYIVIALCSVLRSRQPDKHPSDLIYQITHIHVWWNVPELAV